MDGLDAVDTSNRFLPLGTENEMKVSSTICRTARSPRAVVVLASLAFAFAIQTSFAQDDSPPAPPPTGDTETSSKPKPKKSRSVHKPRREESAKSEQTKSEITPKPNEPKPLRPQDAPNPTPTTAQAKAVQQYNFAAQLDKAGISRCDTQVNFIARTTMESVVNFNTVSNWASAFGDKRSVSLSIGQKYADKSNVPYGASQLVAAPNPDGSCDGFVTQILPSPLSCAKLRETIGTHGRQIGDLSGIVLMQDANGQSLLVPATGNTCVLVTNRSYYLK